MIYHCLVDKVLVCPTDKKSSFKNYYKSNTLYASRKKTNENNLFTTRNKKSYRHQEKLHRYKNIKMALIKMLHFLLVRASKQCRIDETAINTIRTPPALQNTSFSMALEAK